ncbi:hypothetical protein SAMN02745165_01085 [Malonomonas rubra DSM 5091]|uniref:Uncharacterized protein n=1 Tax=Malonomonas rubra DSM 5091 TaxID=1122189 RepID=A0A1M6EYJ0_MALRU|nr:hypothetical protein [Malonomonas rubra]SHI90492.1 hypothetical protein SAMN02745165_01085 [Malonomonas rubra DSM 5091]
MTVYRQWFCKCSGKALELVGDPHIEEESLEPTCPRCGATPSSDPKHTISFKDRDNYSD